MARALAGVAAAASPGGSGVALPQALRTPFDAALTPAPLKAVLALSNGFLFGNRVQQDAQEALAALLDGLHEEVNCGVAFCEGGGKPPVPGLEDGELARLRGAAGALAAGGELPRLTAAFPGDAPAAAAFAGEAAVAAESWRRTLLRNKSNVQALFTGQLRSHIACATPGCGRSSAKFDPFQFLQLALPPPAPAGAAAASPGAAAPAAPLGVTLLVTLCAGAPPAAAEGCAGEPPLRTPVEVALHLPADASYGDARAAVAALTGAAPEGVHFYVARRSGVVPPGGGAAPPPPPSAHANAAPAARSLLSRLTGGLYGGGGKGGVGVAAGVGVAPPPLAPPRGPPGGLSLPLLRLRAVLPEEGSPLSGRLSALRSTEVVVATAALGGGPRPGAAMQLLSLRPSAKARGRWWPVGLPAWVLTASAEPSPAEVWAAALESVSGAAACGALARAAHVALGAPARRAAPALRGVLEALAGAPALLRRPAGARGGARRAALLALLAGGSLLRLKLQRADGTVLLLAPDDDAPLAALGSPPAAPLLLLLEWAPTTLAPLCAAVVGAAAEAEGGGGGAGAGAGAGALPAQPPPWAPAPTVWASAPMAAPLWMVATGHALPALRLEWSRTPSGGEIRSLRVVRPLPPPLAAADLAFLATAAFAAVTAAYPGVSVLGGRPAYAHGEPLPPPPGAGAGAGAAPAPEGEPPALSPARHALRALSAPPDGGGSGGGEHGEGVPADAAFSPPPPPLSLHALLADFTRPEALPQEEGWACPGCGGKRVAATKRLTLWAPPPLLLVHLKRFAYGADGGKLAAPVAAPPTIDLSDWFATRGPPTAALPAVAPCARGAAPLMPAALAAAEAAAAAAAAAVGASPLAAALGTGERAQQKQQQQQATPEEPILYELLAAVNHHGESAHSGHYTAVYRAERRGGGEHAWVLADDARLSVVGVGAEPEFAAGALDDAYILLYARKAKRP